MAEVLERMQQAQEGGGRVIASAHARASPGVITGPARSAVTR
jgi:hypothetical protein